MIFFKKLLFLSLWFFGIFWSSFTFATEWSNSEDFVNQAFSISMDADLVVGKWLVWNTKEWVWNFLLKWGTEIDAWDIIKDWVHADINKKDSFVVSLTRFIVRFTLVIAITMIIYNWIVFVVKSTKWEAPKDVLKNIIYIIVWVLLALASVVIIRLANSVGTTALEVGKDMVAYHSTDIFNS